MRKVINGPTMEVFGAMMISSDIGTVIIGKNLLNSLHVQVEDGDESTPGYIRIDFIDNEIIYIRMGEYIMDLDEIPTIGYIHIFHDEIAFFGGEEGYNPLIFSFKLKKGEIVFADLEEKEDNPFFYGISIKYINKDAVEELLNRT